jgi:dTMP kinase
VSGRFIVLEGGEACGKTTQARLLVARLRAEGREVVATFEPGKTGVGARIRALLLDGPERIAPATEALLLAADRAQHVEEVVRPALERGADVVSDRYVPSSLAYQGIGRGLGVDRVEELNRWATGGLEPDRVVVLDLPDAAAAGREVGPPDRLERESDDFHTRVRDAYRTLAAERGWAVVDAGASVDEVSAAVWAAVAGS